MPLAPGRQWDWRRDSFFGHIWFLLSWYHGNDFCDRSWCYQEPHNGWTSTVEGQLSTMPQGWWWVNLERNSLALRTALKPFGQSQQCLHSTPDLSLFWIHSPGEKFYVDPTDGLLLSSYCLAVEGGNSFSSSFSGCTPGTLFILMKIWLISMKVLDLVSGMIRKT